MRRLPNHKRGKTYARRVFSINHPSQHGTDEISNERNRRGADGFSADRFLRYCPIPLAVLLLCLLTSCQTTPNTPEEHFIIQVNSIPECANLYEVAKDGTPGAYLGQTPHVIRLGYACGPDNRRMWGPGFWSGKKNPPPGFFSHLREYFYYYTVALYVVKDGYRPASLKKTLEFGTSGTRPPSHDVITVHLRAEEPEAPSPPMQQQQQQQQQIVVTPGGETLTSGTVIVSSNVESAEIYVDGVFVGNAPANLRLKEGIHIIELKKSGYSNYRRELRVLGGSEITLRADLSQ